jgi:hypothetical protein
VACARYEGLWESGDIAPWILNLGSRWRGVISFMSRPLLTLAKEHLAPVAGCVGARVGVGVAEKRRMSFHRRESNHVSKSSCL